MVPLWLGFAVAWFIRSVVMKFLVLAAVFAVVAFLVPKAITLLGSFTGTAGLSSAFSALPASVWYWLDLFRLDIGVGVVLSAYTARFLIRRIPVIG